MQEDFEKARQAMIAKRFGGNAKGASVSDGVRRKKQVVHKAGADDQKLGVALKKLNLNTIPGIDEVNMFQDDGKIIHFVAPKVQAAVQSNTFVVNGKAEVKDMTELFPGIVSQLGPESFERLKRLAESLGVNADSAPADDDEVPELVENFEEAAAN